jgi:NTE family protein
MEMHRADGVFQGGGVKGLALAGALVEFADSQRHPQNYVEDWVQLAGTSAGAIVAAYLACGHSAADTAALIEKTDFTQFEDWGPGGELFGGTLNLIRNHGLAHGTVFHDWFRDKIDNQTFGDVHTAKRTLKLIATDITRREMLVLPDSLGDYRLSKDSPPIDPETFPIADAVRMSMSIPYFFQPIELVHSETGPSTIVDGGVLSNFPVWIFDVEDRDPQRPTFGFKLVGGKAAGSGLDRITKAFGWPVEMGVDIFHTATDAWDKYWVSHSTYVRTCAISAGDIGTTQFNLSDAQKQWLLDSGKTAADSFLKEWNPDEYVNSHQRKLG